MSCSGLISFKHFDDCRLRPGELENSSQWRTDRRLPVDPVVYEGIEHEDELILWITSDESLGYSTITSHSSREILSDFQLARDMARAIEIGCQLGKRERSSPELARSEFVLMLPQNAEPGLFSIEFRILWRITPSFLDLRLSAPSQLHYILDKVFPQGHESSNSTSSPQLFYDCAHLPERDATTISLVEIQELKCQLYPFQKRAVRWLLRREGVDVSSSSQLCRYDPPTRPIPPSFRREVDADGRECFVSHLYGAIATNLDDFAAHNGNLFGGILAEEMGKIYQPELNITWAKLLAGLGKTVELIALMCLYESSDS